MKAFYLSILMALALLPAHAQRRYNAMRETKKEFFKTEQARLIGDQILDYQRVTGGWPKNIDMAKPMTHEERQQVLNDKSRRDDSTTDNDATNMQMTYLARLYQATKSKKYREAFCQGVEYLLSGQYDNGGWPQFWPGMRGYQVHITFNDDAMVNTMEMLRDIYLQKAPFDGKLTDKALRQKAIKAFNKGVECILKCQIVKDGKPTIWCQQHDRVTFEPRPARAFELSSYSSNESARIVAMLMEIPNPSEEIKRAIRGAMQWFDTYKLTGLKVVRKGKFGSPFRTTELVKDPDATTPLWARYYDLEHCEPFVCDRDGVPRRHLWEIGTERRNGYSWYSDRTAFIYPLYEKWADMYDTANKLNLSLNSPGANERGLINMNRFSKPELSCFDAIVNAGERIQDAIEKAPENPAKPFKILIRNGVYHEKVIIDRPNIVLVGEDRDSVIISMPRPQPHKPLRNTRESLYTWGSSYCRTMPTTVSSAASPYIIIMVARWRRPPHTRWPSMARQRAPSSSTAISLPTATMPSRYGVRMEECTIMPTSTCAVRVSTLCVLVADAMPHVASLSATAEPSSGTTAEATSTTSLS